jgi:hypothetical protein
MGSMLRHDIEFNVQVLWISHADTRYLLRSSPRAFLTQSHHTALFRREAFPFR